MSNKIILSKDFLNRSKVFVDTALYIAVSKDRDDFALYDGESIKSLSEFICEFVDEYSGKFPKNHIVYKFVNNIIDCLNKVIDSKLDRRNYSRKLEDQLTDYLEAVVICLSHAFKDKYIGVVPLLDAEKKVKYYYYNEQSDDYELKNEVPYTND